MRADRDLQSLKRPRTIDFTSWDSSVDGVRVRSICTRFATQNGTVRIHEYCGLRKNASECLHAYNDPRYTSSPTFCRYWPLSIFIVLVLHSNRNRTNPQVLSVPEKKASECLHASPTYRRNTTRSRNARRSGFRKPWTGAEM